ncbi:hypothetical protein BGZ60DRAFT_275743 [Tricladium varicosporioides]|nr:hypothetical protein BGZ60DRAFT_275743 [Hymenoscyphus varicosporioides]
MLSLSSGNQHDDDLAPPCIAASVASVPSTLAPPECTLDKHLSQHRSRSKVPALASHSHQNGARGRSMRTAEFSAPKSPGRPVVTVLCSLPLWIVARYHKKGSPLHLCASQPWHSQKVDMHHPTMLICALGFRRRNCPPIKVSAQLRICSSIIGVFSDTTRVIFDTGDDQRLPPYQVSLPECGERGFH